MSCLSWIANQRTHTCNQYSQAMEMFVIHFFLINNFKCFSASSFNVIILQRLGHSIFTFFYSSSSFALFWILSSHTRLQRVHCEYKYVRTTWSNEHFSSIIWFCHWIAWELWILVLNIDFITFLIVKFSSLIEMKSVSKTKLIY